MSTTTTTIPGTVTLTPVAAVDTSTATSGVSMYTLVFPSDALTDRNVIQFEYWISNSGMPLTDVVNGFIPLEDAVTTQGISNQCTIAIPSADNDYDPSVARDVKVRVYLGSTDTIAPEIRVTYWSNVCPVHNAPPKPVAYKAFLLRGEYAPSYDNDDVVYVQLQDNDAYVFGEIDFVVTLSYKDVSGDYKWVVSVPLSNWTEHTFTDTSYNAILLPYVVLPTDVDHSSPIYVAVNAVYNYTFNSTNYYSVSEVSSTIQAQEGAIDAPVLETIDIPSDYLVYNTNPVDRLQEVVLNWAPPESSLIPIFAVDHYNVETYVGSTLIATSADIPENTLTYTYSILDTYYDASTVTQLTFQVKATLATGGYEASNTQSVNTFRYATAPRDLVVEWANNGDASNTVDLAITFKNPLNNGLGAVVNFVAKVLDNSSAVMATQTVAYNALTSQYVVYFNDVPTTTTGSVQVYMVTTDTNAQTSSGLYINLDGLIADANYVADNLPQMISYTNDGSSLVSTWVTSDLLKPVGTIDVWDSTLEQVVSLPYLTMEGTYPTYTVVRTIIPETGDHQYVFTFFPAFFGAGVLETPYRMIHNCANNAGIGSGVVDRIGPIPV
jgi:hypothetical protein